MKNKSFIVCIVLSSFLNNGIAFAFGEGFLFMKKIYLGAYELEIDAAIAYNQAATKLHGKFACLNEIPKEFIDRQVITKPINT